MAVMDVSLELIDDNPFNPRKHYSQAKVREMAQSLQEVGLRQVPEGRRVDGRIQLAYGHMRKRGFAANKKKDPQHWEMMPVDVKEISDQDMFHFAMEENLTRTDITPIEVARCTESFSQRFPDVLDEEIARKHHMTAANVSNMKRVLRLPEKILEKIDAGVFTFTQGRELLTLEELENAENLMTSALGGLRTGNKSYGHSNTVEGLQASIHGVISSQYRPLDKEFEGYRWDLLFDTRAAGCLQCDKMIRTHPTKSKAAHYCTSEECWDRHDKEHREQAAAAAKAMMEAEVLERVAKDVDQRTPEPTPPQYTLEKRGTSWIALDAQGVVIAIAEGKKAADGRAIESFEPVVTKVNPGGDEYLLNHTYRFMEKPESRKLEFSDITAQDLTSAAEALGIHLENIERVKVWKSSGKLGTGGDVSAGWSKCTEPLDAISQEKSARWRCGQCNVYFEFSPPEDHSRALVDCPGCQYEYVTHRRADGVLFCVPKHNYAEPPKAKISSTLLSAAGEEELENQTQDLRQRIASAPAPPQEVPEDLLEKAKAAAGTRAEVLDLRPLYTDDWRHELKSGFVNLSQNLDQMDDPEECLERCTRGFHYAFDSKFLDRDPSAICTDPKCAAQKKSALTRKRNAAGQARKKAEVKAVKEAIALTTELDRGRLKLILLAQMDGLHASRTYYYGAEGTLKRPEKWLWDKVSAGVPENDRTKEKLFNAISKLTNEELAKLVVEFMFFYLVDHGDLGSYEIKAREPLGWLGIKIQEGGSGQS